MCKWSATILPPFSPPPWSLPGYSGNMALRNIKYRKLRNIKYRQLRNIKYRKQKIQNTEEQVQNTTNDKRTEYSLLPLHYEIENGKISGLSFDVILSYGEQIQILILWYLPAPYNMADLRQCPFLLNSPQQSTPHDNNIS